MENVFQRVAPVLPVLDVRAALERYRGLGFRAEAYGETTSNDELIYGYVSRGTIQLHLVQMASLNPSTNTSACYLYVDDAQRLYEEWLLVAPEGRLHPPVDTRYGLREFAYVDPDGNLLRIGSRLGSDRANRADVD